MDRHQDDEEVAMQRPVDSPRLSLYFLAFLAFLGALVAVLSLSELGRGELDEEEGKGKRVSGQVEADVVAAVGGSARAATLPASGFAPQTRLGYTLGDQWEPAIAADRFGHVYVLYPQYLGVPGCPNCASPTMILQTSADRGATWAAPWPLAPSGTSQVDAQIVVDPSA